MFDSHKESQSSNASLSLGTLYKDSENARSKQNLILKKPIRHAIVNRRLNKPGILSNSNRLELILHVFRLLLPKYTDNVSHHVC